MNYLYKWTGNILLALQVLLLFLVIASEKVELPTLLEWGGKLHPLLLHLPIGLFIFTTILWVLRKQLRQSNEVFTLVLAFSALSVSLTAISGFFLSKTGGYEAELLQRHQWSGVVLSLITWGLWTVVQYAPNRIKWLNMLFAGGFLSVFITGHWGGQLTHGADFLAWPTEISPSEQVQPVVSSSETFFAAYVQPIWEQKCVSCHRADKSKGGLILTDAAQAFKGGKTGAILVSGDAKASLFLQRVHLPLTDKKHMPPRGKMQLEPGEIELLEAWVNTGADIKRTIGEIGESDPLHRFIQVVSETGSATTSYTFKPASSATIEKLNDAFLVVKPIAAESPALQADFFIRKAWDSKKLDALQDIAPQLVRLNLSNMPVEDNDLKKLLPFKQLEKLILNHTQLTDAGLGTLKDLPALKSVSFVGTRISVKAGSTLGSFPVLKEVFLWNTQVKPAQIAQLQKKYPRIKWNYGFTPSPTDILALSPPVFEDVKPVMSAGDSIRLKVTIPGAQIRYTLDGKIPDSTTGVVYRAPIAFKDITTIKARAFKQGWIGSDVVEKTIYKRGKTPEKIVLLTTPNAEYAPQPTVLTNELLGDITQFRSGQWIGYKDRHMEALCYFNSKTPPSIASVALSYGVNVGSYILPPVDVEIWGGMDGKNLSLLAKEMLAPITMLDLADQESRGIVLRFKKAEKYSVYKLVVHNVPKLPEFHPGKGTPGWVFLDEVFFN